MGNISKRSATSSFNSPDRNHINNKKKSSWGFNDVGIFFLFYFFSVFFKTCMAFFDLFQYLICGIHGLINVKIVLNKVTDAISV